VKLKRTDYIFGLVLLFILLIAVVSIYRGFGGGRRIDVTQLPRAEHPLFAGK